MRLITCSLQMNISLPKGLIFMEPKSIVCGEGGGNYPTRFSRIANDLLQYIDRTRKSTPFTYL